MPCGISKNYSPRVFKTEKQSEIEIKKRGGVLIELLSENLGELEGD